ncbi:dihydrodipicolinate synthase family protein [Frigidibacter sp. ROC022]|uniref:dihydrodipicolinate synthase family protein n=1 Tax=Frigidibacter sp. ROC022 TaxID=2971796 RepID=UPI00215A8471|nr:dihydrodipicolinate synthase family protein [Frigidibacter sp. ROC022]MCR8724639.1 dihydrodipicolinate synthase family protein [Frigidibacter sp. ROC022]
MAFAGVLPIVPTPFLRDGQPDHAGLRAIVDDAIAAGTSALVYPGVASEDVHLTAEERADCIRLVAEAAAGAVPLIAGVNSADPAEMVKLAETAAGLGAGGIMAMAVPSMAPDFAGWFNRIGAATGGLPIILQNMAGPRGAALSVEAMIDLAKAVPAIRYVKEETVPSGPGVSGLVAGASGALDGVIGGGGARYLFEELERGVIGTMPAIELLRLHVALMRAHAAGDRARALDLWERSVPLLLIQAPYRMRLTKLILKHRGLISHDGVREPLPEMDDRLERLVIELYERLPAEARELSAAAGTVAHG